MILESDNLAVAFGILAVVLLIWNFSISVRIMNYIKEKGEQVNPALMHVRIFDLAQKYKRITTEENGKPGKFYAQFLLSFVLFAIFLFLGIISVL